MRCIERLGQCVFVGGSVCVRNVKSVHALVVGFVRRVSRVVYVVRIRVEYKTGCSIRAGTIPFIRNNNNHQGDVVAEGDV